MTAPSRALADELDNACTSVLRSVKGAEKNTAMVRLIDLASAAAALLREPSEPDEFGPIGDAELAYPDKVVLPVTRAEFAALDTRERQHHIALTQYVGDSRAEFAALKAEVVAVQAASITRDAMHRNVASWLSQHDEQIEALRDLALALAEPASGQTVHALAQKLKEAR